MRLGRPREFDMDEALDRALAVFWRRGFEGASIAELTQAMGINPPSLYAAFGNKQGLFRKVLDRYLSVRTTFWDDAMKEPTARGLVERLLHGTADFMTDPANPPGCLLVRGTLACSDMAQDVHRQMVECRCEGERVMRDRFAAAQANGELPADADPAALAGYVATVLEGMSVHAAGGATREELHKVADTALRAWPS
ncbi:MULTISPECIES: TetR/AcrR family transcriptional regulator [Rhodoplanes]|nr:TetR/AcrR family transcriptional regulator [Rhodoplanes serenus]